MKWKRFTGKQIDDLEATILQDIASSEYPTTWYVGGDSMRRHETTTYTIVIAMLKEGHGGKGYYRRANIHEPHISRQQRLFKETYETVEVALFVNPILERVGLNIKEVHLDINSDPKFGSYEMMNQCLGYVRGMGFNGILKPDSWCSMEIADRYSK